MAEEIAAAVTRGGRGDLWRAAQLPRGLVTRALQGLPPETRSRAVESIAEAKKMVRQYMGPSTGPLVFAQHDLHSLARIAQRHSALAPVVKILKRQAVRNELAKLRYDAARALQFEAIRREREPSKPTLDPFSEAGADAIYAHRNAMQTDPVARVRHNRWSELCHLVTWTDRAVAALEAGDDATHAVAQAYRCRLEMVVGANEGLWHIHYEVPTRRLREAAQDQAAGRQRNLSDRNEAIRAAAAALWKQHPAWGALAVANRLATSSTLSARQIRRIIPPRKSLAT